MTYDSVKEIHRCQSCDDSGVLFARDKQGNLYAFQHSCSVGAEKRSSYPSWTQRLSDSYTPENRSNVRRIDEGKCPDR